MTDLDLRLRDLTAELVVGGPAPAFEELRLATVDRRHRLRRGPILALAAAVLVALAIASVVLIRTETAGRSAPVAPAHQDTAPAPTHNDVDAASTSEWTDAAMLRECDTADVTLLSPAGTETMRIADYVTHEPVEVDAREFCRTTEPLLPDPDGNMTVAFHYANRALVATYYERIITRERDANGLVSENHTTGDPIPPEEAAQRLAAQKAARDGRR